MYTGGNGSGKTLFSIIDVKKCYFKNRVKVWWHNLWHSDKWDKVEIFSNIPLKIKGKFVNELKVEHLLFQEALPPRCIVFIDEVNLFLSQMENRFFNRSDLELFVTLYRHITFGGYFVANTQNINKVNCIFRYCLNESNNLFGFNQIPLIHLLAWTRCRNISVGEDIMVIEQGQKEENYRFLFCLPFKHYGTYDTYCYSNITLSVPNGAWKDYYDFKVNRLLKLDTSEKRETYDFRL